MKTAPERPAVIKTFAFGIPEVNGRNVSGIVVPYNRRSRNYGPDGMWVDVFAAGSVRVRDDIPTPLIEGHNADGFPVGASTDWENREDGLWMEFAVAKTPRGDEALTLIRDGFCRGVSVGLGGYTETLNEARGEWDISDGELLHVGVTGQPKFTEAAMTRVFDMGETRPVRKAAAPSVEDELRAEIRRLKHARRMDRLESLRR